VIYFSPLESEMKVCPLELLLLSEAKIRRSQRIYLALVKPTLPEEKTEKYSFSLPLTSTISKILSDISRTPLSDA
jgi:hypothetical protein